MLRWLGSWFVSVGWYGLMVAGWLCWFKAHARANELDRQLTVMAHSWRYTARQKPAPCSDRGDRTRG